MIYYNPWGGTVTILWKENGIVCYTVNWDTVEKPKEDPCGHLLWTKSWKGWINKRCLKN